MGLRRAARAAPRARRALRAHSISEAPSAAKLLGDRGAEADARAGDDGAPPVEFHATRPTEIEREARVGAERGGEEAARSRAQRRPALHSAISSGREIAKFRPFCRRPRARPRPARPSRRRRASDNGGSQIVWQARHLRVERLHACALLEQGLDQLDRRRSGAACWCRLCRRGRGRPIVLPVSGLSSVPKLVEKPIGRGRDCSSITPSMTGSVKSMLARETAQGIDVARQRAARERRTGRDIGALADARVGPQVLSRPPRHRRRPARRPWRSRW